MYYSINILKLCKYIYEPEYNIILYPYSTT